MVLCLARTMHCDQLMNFMNTSNSTDLVNTVLAVSHSVLIPTRKVHYSLINLELINFNLVCSGKNASISCLKQCIAALTMYNQLCKFQASSQSSDPPSSSPPPPPPPKWPNATRSQYNPRVIIKGPKI